MTAATTRKLEKAVAEFNRRFPVGSEVMLKKDFVPEPVRTRTRSEAFVMCGHSAVVFLEGDSGSYLISHVSEVPLAPHSPLVEAARLAICRGLDVNPVTHSYVYLAEAAVSACHADEMRASLGEVGMLLRTCLKDYGEEPWAQRIVALLSKLGAAS